MKILPVTLVVATLIVPGFAYAQRDFRYEIYGGYVHNIATRGALSNWDDGWMFGLGFPFQINPNLQIVLSGSHQRFRYIGQNVQLGLPDIAGLRSKTTGERSKLFEAALAIRLIAPGKALKPFLAFKGGMYFINVGEIHVITWFEQNPGMIQDVLYGQTGKSLIKGFGALAYGINIPINPNVAIQFEGSLAGTFEDGNDSFALLIAAVQFQL